MTTENNDFRASIPAVDEVILNFRDLQDCGHGSLWEVCDAAGTHAFALAAIDERGRTRWYVPIPGLTTRMISVLPAHGWSFRPLNERWQAVPWSSLASRRAEAYALLAQRHGHASTDR